MLAHLVSKMQNNIAAHIVNRVDRILHTGTLYGPYLTERNRGGSSNLANSGDSFTRVQ